MDEQKDKLYSFVYNNIYIKRIIFSYLNKYNTLLSVNIIFNSLKEWQEFKYKEYLYRITLDFEEEYDLNQLLPENIKHITIRSPFIMKDKDNGVISIPDHIESVGFLSSFSISQFNYLQQLPYSSKIQKLSLQSFYDIKEYQNLSNNQQVYLAKNGSIEKTHLNNKADSFTDLEISFQGGTKLSKNILPANLKKLVVSNLKFYDDECFPIESLTDVTFLNTSHLLINEFSRPSTIDSINLVKLNFSNHNLNIDINVQFPNTLEELKIICNSFNSKLPDNLKSLRLNIRFYQHSIEFPKSLEQLSIIINRNLLYQNILPTRQSVPPNLKSLEFECSSFIEKNGQSILPDKLEKLIILGSFDQELKANQLPSSLTYLDLGPSFDQYIDFNVLPAKLNTLILKKYSKIINPLAIPQHLKLLQINIPQHSINLVSTHPYTVIRCCALFSLCYQASSPHYKEIHVLRLPDLFELSLSTLNLQDKSNLEYLHLGLKFNRIIELSDLPIQNNIKTLILNHIYDKIINLEHFQNLETLIIQSEYSTITSSTTITIDEKQQQHVHYNNYKLKNIIVSPTNYQFLKNLDINFYQFIKYRNNN